MGAVLGAIFEKALVGIRSPLNCFFCQTLSNTIIFLKHHSFVCVLYINEDYIPEPAPATTFILELYNNYAGLVLMRPGVFVVSGKVSRLFNEQIKGGQAAEFEFNSTDDSGGLTKGFIMFG